MRARTACFAVVTVAALALSGCGGDDGGSGAGQQKNRKGSSAERDSSDGGSSGKGAEQAGTPESLNFSAKTLKGSTVKGSELRGKPTVLWFWAPWCGTCKQQAASTSALAEDYNGEVNVLGVAGLDKEPPMKTFVSENGVDNFNHIADPQGSVWKRFSVTRQSIYVLLDRKGDEVGRGTFDGEADLRKRVEGMLS